MLLSPQILASPSKAAAAWTPASLGSALIAWYKADAGVFVDAGVTLATNSQTVQQWNDQSGNGYHLQQSNAALRPAYLTNTLNSLPVIDTNSGSANRILSTVSQPVALGGTHLSAFFVRKVIGNGGASNVRVLTISTPGSADLGADTAIIEYCPGTSLIAPTSFNNGNKSTGTVVSGSWNQIGTIFDGANDTMYIANSAQTPVAATPTFAANVDINIFEANLFAQCAEIVFTNTALSSTDRNNLATYYTTRWGI